jgi:hypothetical protein
MYLDTVFPYTSLAKDEISDTAIYLPFKLHSIIYSYKDYGSVACG